MIDVTIAKGSFNFKGTIIEGFAVSLDVDDVATHYYDSDGNWIATSDDQEAISHDLCYFAEKWGIEVDKEYFCTTSDDDYDFQNLLEIAEVNNWE